MYCFFASLVNRIRKGVFARRFIRFFGIACLGLFIVSLDAKGHFAGMASSERSREAIARVRPELEERLAKKGLSFGAPIFIRIFKTEKELELWVQDGAAYRLFADYPVCSYGRGGLGPKLKEGDGKAPEGFYFVPPEHLNPVSRFHLSFNLGYPNLYDRAHARTGSALMVHGSCVSIGCFAMTDPGIEQIYALANAALSNGQRFFRVHIFPFRMTPENMKHHRNSEWIDFWRNLEEGYAFFEENGHCPPNVAVENGRYVFEPIFEE